MRFFAIVCFMLGMSVAARAQDALKPLDRLDTAKHWQAVGRLDMGNSSFCTGTLIASDLVLTAAHCLYDNMAGRIGDHEIQFRAGWKHGRAAAYRNVRRSVLHPDYVYSGREKVENLHLDLALLQLDRPIRHPNILPFATTTTPMTGLPLTGVSYAKDRAETASIENNCRILAHEGGIYVTSCSVDFGASGAPLFTMKDGRPAVFTVVSAKALWQRQKVSLAVGLSGVLETLMAQIEASDGVFHRTAPHNAPVFLKAKPGASGQRFIKP